VTGHIKKTADRLITGDTGGRIKCWDISKVNFKTPGRDHLSDMRVSWYVQGHKKGGSINSLKIVQKFQSDRFVVSASADNNVLFHRISNGVLVGKFSSEKSWNIEDMSEFEFRRPNMVREWLRSKIARWLKFLEEKVNEGKAAGVLDEETTVKTIKNIDKEKLKDLGIAGSDGKASLGAFSADGGSDPGDVDYLQFSDEEEDEYKNIKG
jgi:hypothetical protein